MPDKSTQFPEIIVLDESQCTQIHNDGMNPQLTVEDSSDSDDTFGWIAKHYNDVSLRWRNRKTDEDIKANWNRIYLPTPYVHPPLIDDSKDIELEPPVDRVVASPCVNPDDSQAIELEPIVDCDDDSQAIELAPTVDGESCSSPVIASGQSSCPSFVACGDSCASPVIACGESSSSPVISCGQSSCSPVKTGDPWIDNDVSLRFVLKYFLLKDIDEFGTNPADVARYKRKDP